MDRTKMVIRTINKYDCTMTIVHAEPVDHDPDIYAPDGTPAKIISSKTLECPLPCLSRCLADSFTGHDGYDCD